MRIGDGGRDWGVGGAARRYGTAEAVGRAGVGREENERGRVRVRD